MLEFHQTKLSHPKPDRHPIGISMAGKCVRQISYAAREYPKYDHPNISQFRNALTLELGSRAHEIAQKYIVGLYDAEREVTLESNGVTIHGHIDGLVNSNGKIFLVEIKTMNEFSYKRFKTGQDDYIDRSYQYQAHTYIKALRKAAVDVAGVIFLAISRSTLETSQRCEPYDDEMGHEGRDNLMLGVLRRPETLPRLKSNISNGQEHQLDWRCSYCPYWRECWAEFNVRPDEEQVKLYVSGYEP